MLGPAVTIGALMSLIMRLDTDDRVLATFWHDTNLNTVPAFVAYTGSNTPKRGMVPVPPTDLDARVLLTTGWGFAAIANTVLSYNGSKNPTLLVLGGAGGIATLDAGGKLNPNQIPDKAVEVTVTVANQAARLALTSAQVQNGDRVKQTDTSEFFELQDDTAIGNVLSWLKVSPTAWSEISNKPTTLGGFGITDGVPNTRTVVGTGVATGGGDLSANREINVESASAAETYAGADVNKVVVPVNLPIRQLGNGSLMIGHMDATTLGDGAIDIQAVRNGTDGATSNWTINIGSGGVATGENSINIGILGDATGGNSCNFGYSGIANQLSVNVGYAGGATGTSSVNVGAGGQAGPASANVGYQGNVSGEYSCNFGYGGTANNQGINVGASGSAGVNGINIGFAASATGDGINIGGSGVAIATGLNIGHSGEAGAGGINIGNTGFAGANAVNVGFGGAAATLAVSVGISGVASQQNATAIGTGTQATGEAGTAVGAQAQANGFMSASFGYQAQASSGRCTTVGAGTTNATPDCSQLAVTSSFGYIGAVRVHAAGGTVAFTFPINDSAAFTYPTIPDCPEDALGPQMARFKINSSGSLIFEANIGGFIKSLNLGTPA